MIFTFPGAKDISFDANVFLSLSCKTRVLSITVSVFGQCNSCTSRKSERIVEFLPHRNIPVVLDRVYGIRENGITLS
jgi:hypothetical protein